MRLLEHKQQLQSLLTHSLTHSYCSVSSCLYPLPVLVYDDWPPSPETKPTSAVDSSQTSLHQQKGGREGDLASGGCVLGSATKLEHAEVSTISF